jgi:hypothetical protein
MKRNLGKGMCKHPKLAKKVMTEFVEKAMSTTLDYYDVIFNKMDFEAKDFDFQEVYLTPTVTLKHTNRFSAVVGGWIDDPSDITITYSPEALMGNGENQFRDNFTERCPIGKGFANVTLALLHELGHFETYNDIPQNFDREETIKDLRKNYPIHEHNYVYFSMPDEALATEWAINWLEDADNRKIAKAFEKKYFECFKKTA